jgi:hypothetical protein
LAGSLPVRFSKAKQRFNAGWSSPVARQAHNLKVIGSNPIPATTDTDTPVAEAAGVLVCASFSVRRSSPAQDCAQIAMEGGVDLAALGTRAENDAFDQAAKSLGGLGPVFRTVQSLGEVGDLLGVELRGARGECPGYPQGLRRAGQRARLCEPPARPSLRSSTAGTCPP